MFLRLFALRLFPENPVLFSITGLRAYLTRGLADYSALHKDSNAEFVHRYPPLQCKLIKNNLMVIGISQGADFLLEIVENQQIISPGENACSVEERTPGVRLEPFGIGGNTQEYEFLTPLLALNQQNAKRFYELTGKPKRDAFMQKILLGTLSVLVKSLDYKPPAPITCKQKLRFRKDWIDNKSVMVFTGRFQTNLSIPDYIGIGQSVSLGFGAIRHLTDEHGSDSEDTRL